MGLFTEGWKLHRMIPSKEIGIETFGDTINGQQIDVVQLELREVHE